MSEFDDSLKQIIAMLVRAHCPSGVRYLIKLPIDYPNPPSCLMISTYAGYRWSFRFLLDDRLDILLELCGLNQTHTLDNITIAISSPNFIADLSAWLDRRLLNRRTRPTDESFNLFSADYGFVSSTERYSDE